MTYIVAISYHLAALTCKSFFQKAAATSMFISSIVNIDVQPYIVTVTAGV